MVVVAMVAVVRVTWARLLLQQELSFLSCEQQPVVQRSDFKRTSEAGGQWGCDGRNPSPLAGAVV